MAVAMVGERYRMLQRVGSGGMGSVYLGEDTLLGRRVAIKRLNADRLDGLGGRRFQREARIGAGLSHPNLVSVFDAIEEDDGLLIVMEYVEGTTLADLLRSGGPAHPLRALEILRPLALALDHVHARGVVHRDVKPSNVLLATDGAIKLADLGVATGSGVSRITASGAVLGTAAYLAPELFEGDPAGPASDLYSLAAVAYETLCGARAANGSTPAQIARQVTSEDPPDIRAIWPGASPAVATALRRGLARDPEERPDSAAQLVDALALGLTGPEYREPPRPPARVRPAPACEPRRAATPPPPTGWDARSGDARSGDARPGDARSANARSANAQSAPEHDSAPPPARRQGRHAPLAAAAAIVVAVALVLVLVIDHQQASQSGRSAAAASSGRGAGGNAGASAGAPARGRTSAAAGSRSGVRSASAPGARSGTAGARAGIPVAGATSASSPAGAVQAFYQRAAAHRFASAWTLASPRFQAQLLGYHAFVGQQRSLRSITFKRAQTIQQSAAAAVVAIQTVATHVGRVDHCVGTVQLVSGAGTWRLDHISVQCQP